jgi:GAF domain-containing protein
MLEDITLSATQSFQKVKVLAVTSEHAVERLSVDSRISFLPFINYLKDKISDSTATRSRFYNYLIEKFEAEPALLEPVMDSALLDENRNLLELLSTTLFPVVSDAEKNIFTLAVPYQFSIFNYSDTFRKLFIDADEENFLLLQKSAAEQLKQVQCSLIYEHVLDKFYGIKLNDKPELVFPVLNAKTGMMQYYKFSYDRRFIDIQLKGQLPQIQDCAVCLNTFRIMDLEMQLQKMPLDLFSVEGFGVWIAEDVTSKESLDAMKKVLLRQEDCDTGIIQELKANINALIGLNDVEIGLTPFVKLHGQFILDESCTIHGLIGNKWKTFHEASQSHYQECIEFLKEHPEPVPISNLDENMVGVIPLLKGLWMDGYRSYIIYPIQNNDGLLGILELASVIPNHLNHEVMRKLEPAMPLLSWALLKNRDNFNQRIEKLIKEKFTALQPSVEWKFAQTAWEYMHNVNSGSAIRETGNVVFENVYPLYGAIDIRNSSIERSKAIKKDLKAHLNLVDDSINQLLSVVELPLLEGLKFKNQYFLETIENGLPAEEEVKINEFFECEVDPVFRHLQKTSPALRELTDNYFNLAEDRNGYLNRFRREYEISMETINESILANLEKENKTLQISYPHYVEKYKTDGVEYTIYIGQSISPNNQFDLLYLKNIRIWQLKSMAEIARITNQLMPDLKVPLQTTQLILIQSQPISISFRKDERKFDVEGSYNIRYEIMKKRLDKALVKGTTERLTQPGKIAMVYSNPKEAFEYQEYIKFLQSKNLLQPGLEFLELDELQGVSGLKAMRVDINL